MLFFVVFVDVEEVGVGKIWDGGVVGGVEGVGDGLKVNVGIGGRRMLGFWVFVVSLGNIFEVDFVNEVRGVYVDDRNFFKFLGDSCEFSFFWELF